MSIWIHAIDPSVEEETLVVEPSEEEVKQYEDIQVGQIKMEPIYSPPLLQKLSRAGLLKLGLDGKNIMRKMVTQ